MDKEPEVSVEEVKEDQEEPSSDLEDEDYEEDQLQEQYFTSANPKTTQHKWLVLFYWWLNTADAGRKEDRKRLQHASHIRLMLEDLQLEDLQPGGDGIDVLSADEGQIVWTDWVDVKLLSLKSGTINGYLGTYEKFLQFVVEDRVRVTEYPPVDPEVKRIFMNTILKLKGWRRTVDLEGRAETNQRQMDECTYRLTTDDVKAFLYSPICVNARKVFDKANDKYMLTVNEICEARDYLITMISLKTGTCPGALENLKLQEYSQAKADPNTCHKVLLVPQHKRQSDGQAPLAIDNKVEGLFNIFLREIYHQFPAPRGPTIFLRNDGTSFQFGTISKRLPEFWRKSNIHPDIRVTATNIRKWIVTACNMKKKEGLDVDEETLRGAMCHSDKVAKKCHLREDLTTVAASAMEIISSCSLAVENPTTTAKTTDNSEQSVMSEKGEAHDPNTDSCEVVSPPSAEERTSQEPPVNSQQPMISDKRDTRDPNINSCGVVSPPSAEKGTSQEPPVNSQQSMSDKGETHDPNTDSSEVVSPPSADEGTEKAPLRKKLSVNQKEAIEALFGDLIQSSIQILMSDVKERMKDNITLRTLLPFPGMVKKVVDRIRSVQRLQLRVREPTVQPQDLPTSQPQEATRQWLETAESVASSSSTRMDWSQDETDIIMKHFGHIKEHPKKKLVTEAFQTIDELIPLLEAKGLQRCYNKVKNTLNKLRKQQKWIFQSGPDSLVFVFFQY